MFCIENSYRFPIVFPDQGIDPHSSFASLPVEYQIFSRYMRSVAQRLQLIIRLQTQGKLDAQTVKQEIQVLRAQLRQTRHELGITG